MRMGMVGGGRGAFIGAVHRMAAALDSEIELVCGAFSSKPEKSIASGKDLYLPEDRCYGTYEEMILKEKELPEGERMDFVSIVTPNHVHFPPAKMALEKAAITEIIIEGNLKLQFDYPILNEVMRIINKNKVRIVDRTMEEKCAVVIAFPKGQKNKPLWI